jgi:hypothetical protein
MSKMSEIDAEVQEMTMDELVRAFQSLNAGQSKGVRDEFMQEVYAQELDRRENMWKMVTV